MEVVIAVAGAVHVSRLEREETVAAAPEAMVPQLLDMEQVAVAAVAAKKEISSLEATEAMVATVVTAPRGLWL